MYVLKSDKEYLKSIKNDFIENTEKISEAIILNGIAEAQKLLDFCNVFADFYYEDDYVIAEIKIEEVE